MRSPLSRRHVARRPITTASTSLKSFLTVSALALIPTSQAINFTAVPNSFLDVDISSLGQVGFAGDFTGISLFQFEGQDETPFNTNGSEGLLARLPNGVFTTVLEADASIQSMCDFVANGVAQGVIIAGNFTSLGDYESTGVALFNPNTTEVRPLTGLQGSVSSVLCDDDTVYIGGNFMGIDNSTNAVSWVDGAFRALPFAGFNGPVSSIAKTSNGHIIFGGSFTGLGNASTPSTPDEQLINLSTANITARGSNTRSGFSNPSNIICSTSGDDGAGNTWLLADDTAGSWQASMGFGYRPTKLRIYNTRQDGRGTKTWRYTALPINGIMNFTYIDPETKQNLTCTSECPLSSNLNVTFQDFHFVNVIGMNAFRIDISDWYGSGGGLNGIELFTDDIFAFAINDFNEPTCANISTVSSATRTGSWTVSPSFSSNSEYLTAQLSNPITNDSASVVFFPDIRESGYYTVNMYTPGCLGDSSCSTRGQVQLTGTMSPTMGTNGTISTSLFQTNNYDKYDPIYYGYVDATSDSFRPAVTLTPANGQSVFQQTVVAQRVGFVLYNTTGGLNGLFEYDPSVTEFNTSDFHESVFDKLGMNFTTGSAVTALATVGDVTYVGGNFSTSTSNNIVSINSQDSTVQTLDKGLNGLVASMAANGTSLWVGGSFSNTQGNDVSGLANVAVYDSPTASWSALGAGVNGPVSLVVPLAMNISDTTPEIVISFTGNFSQLNAFGNNQAVPTNGFGVWVPSKANWLVNLEFPVEYLDGMLTTSVLEVTGSDPLYAGTVISSTLGAVGAASLSGSASDFILDDFGAMIQSDPISSVMSTVKRDTANNGNASGVLDGAFLKSNDLNITVLAGQFTATATNGSIIHNVAIVNTTGNTTITGFVSGVSQDSMFAAVAIQESTLFAGGNVTGFVSGTNVSGLVSFDLKANDYGSQPPPLEGGNATVSAIAIRPKSGDVYVGGSFTSAGALGCPAVCYFSTSSSQWNRPGNNLAGEARSIAWVTNKKLIAGGNFTVNGARSFLVSYTSGGQSWDVYPGANELPGPVDIIVTGSSDGKQLWVAGTATNGSTFLMKYDGSKWQSAGQPFESGTDIQSLQMLSLTESKVSSSLLDAKMSLMLTGNIVIPDFGSASAALFNGTALTPFALTTNSGNKAGTISRIFVEKTNFFGGESSGHLPIYAIVLIGLGIALGLTLLIVVAGMAMERLRKKREGYVPAPTSMYDRGSGMQRIPPHELLESLGKGRPGAPHV
ncbi:Polarized growth protein rax2 [Cytospora mali]|uniref:Polarized growth protein rax2 n=1 Tax=Cytospora mali TaxID=578113 RepID=A0A194VVP7_CYTMA|nr:Polarized growth protein rax2 [Valsa mali]